MRAIRNLLWFVVGIGIAAAFMFPSAYAQAPANAAIDPAFNRILNGIVSNTPGVVTQSIPSGVSTVGTGTSTVTTASGLRIPIPETATASVSKSAIAKGASKVLKGGNALGIGLLALDVYKALLEDAVFTACPAPNYLCKKHVPTSSDSPYLLEQGGWYGIAPCTTSATCTLTAVVALLVKSGCGTGGKSPTYGVPFMQNGGVRTVTIGCMTSDNRGPFGAGNATTLNATPTPYVPPTEPSTESSLEQAVLDALAANPSLAKKYYDAIRADNLKRRILDGTYKLPDDTPLNFPPDTPIVLPPDTPLDIYAPPVTTQEKITKTRTIPLSDGTVDTEVTKEKTTVTPTKTGTTVGDTKITYPTTTTQTTTTTNNTTNNTTTTTTVINESPQTKPPEPPKDPCEGNPNRAGCALLGEPPAAEAIPNQDVPISVSPVSFSSAAGCPSAEIFQAYGAKSISYQPTCDTMSKFRSLFLALASLTAAIVFMGGLRL